MNDDKNGRPSLLAPLGDDKEKGNVLILGIGAWFVILAFAFAIMAASDLYIDKRDLAAEADFIALSLADDIEESSYYGGESDFHVSERELLQRADGLVRYDSEIVQLSSRSDGSIYIRLKRTVPVFVIPALTDVGNVDLYASSSAYLRDYQTP